MNTIKQPRRVFDPQQKITAVLSIWSERRTTAQLCQEMDISAALLGQWQNLAIEGMLRALDPKQKDPLPPINQRLTRLIEKKLAGSKGKLEKRLRAIQKTRAVTTTS
jgi:transposase-like protein